MPLSLLLSLPSKNLEDIANDITHLGVVAHQDDLEMVATEAIVDSYQAMTPFFGGIVVTDGRGSPREGRFASTSDEEMVVIRRREQEAAAKKGRYQLLAQLNIPSAAIKEEKGSFEEAVTELHQLLVQLQPKVIYTHQPFDRHPTHRAVLRLLLAALKKIPFQQRPQQLWGGEVWGSLEWLLALSPTPLRAANLSGKEAFLEELLGCFVSQLEGGKAYDKAFLGRLRAHATFSASHQVDQAELLAYLLDLTPLITEPEWSLKQFVQELLERFRGSFS